MFQCKQCGEYIEDGSVIYMVKEGMVIDGKDDSLEIEDEKFMFYCSTLCLVTDFN